MAQIKFINLMSLLALVIFVNSSYAYKKIKCFVIQPPEQVLQGVSRIAVLDFTTEGASESEEQIKKAEDLAVSILSDIIKGSKDKPTQINYGKNFSDLVISELIKKERGVKEIETGVFGLGKGREGQTLQQGTFTNVYEVVERSQLNQVLEEQKLGASGAIDDSQAATLGKLLGVQAIVAGNVKYSHKDSEYTEERTEKKNNKEVKKKVDCQRREVSVAVRARIISSETGQILGSTESSETLKESSCEDSYKSLPAVDEMIDKGLKKVGTNIVSYFAPYYKQESFELEKIKGDKFKDAGEKAAALAEEIKVDEAYTIYKSIYDKDAYNPEVLYDLGILNEVVGNFTQAEEFYGMALQLKDEGDYKKALNRIEKNVRFAESLAAMGVVIQEHEFQVSERSLATALAKKVKTKGNRSDRISAYQQASLQSEVIAQLPGDLTFTVLEREGSFYLIQLLGGKQGYVHQDKVDMQN